MKYMSKKVIILVVVVLFILVSLLLARLAYLSVLPINPNNPYLSGIESKIPDTKWTLGFFQPVFLYQYEKDGGAFFKTLHRNFQKKAVMMDVFVGGNLDGENYSLATFVDEGEVRRNIKFGSFRYTLKPGSRIKIEYLTETNTLSKENREDLCQAAEKLCEAANLEKRMEGADFVTFSKKGDLESKYQLPVIAIYTKIDN